MNGDTAGSAPAPGSSLRPDWPLAVVVGAGGMGMAVARRLGHAYRLLVADRDAAHLDRQIEWLANAGYDATGICCDVTAPADVDRLGREAATRGPVRALAYVVGLSPSLGDFRAIMTVNLVGAARAVSTFHEILVPGGVAVCISSSAAHMQPAPEAILPLLDKPLEDDLLPRIETMLRERATPATAYMLSKMALIRLCQHSASAWGARQLRILSLSPGLVATPQGAGEYRHSPAKAGLFDATPLGREGTMLEIAGVVEFLLSDQASYISGTDILVDGGLIASLGCRDFR